MDRSVRNTLAALHIRSFALLIFLILISIAGVFMAVEDMGREVSWLLLVIFSVIVLSLDREGRTGA